jgi:hypothetical protein
LSGFHPLQARYIHAASQKLGQNSQSLLSAFIARQAGSEELETMTRAIEIGEQVHTHFMAQESFDAIPGQCRIARDQQPSIGHHEARRQVVTNIDFGGEAC